jgi:hypothetical protein
MVPDTVVQSQGVAVGHTVIDVGDAVESVD